LNRKLALIALIALLLPSSAKAQSEVDLMSIERSLPLVSRSELEESLAWHQALADSAGVKNKDREKALEAIESIRSRLEEGDFRPGDRIFFMVVNEPEFPDTLMVEAGPAVLIPNVGNVSLKGVLRSELQGHLTEELARFIRDPEVRAQPTIRLTLSGSVGTQGFYTFPATTTLGDAIMAAGGPTTESRMGSVKVMREGLTLIGGDEAQMAIAQGWTFDQLGLRPGDEVNVPERIFTVRRIVTMGVGIASVLLLGFQIYGGGR